MDTGGGVRAIYAESSAILRWLLGAPGSGRVQAVLATAAYVASSALTSAEVGRTLRRLGATGALAPSAVTRAFAAYGQAAARWILVTLSDPILARAAESFPAEPLRTFDAIHLATAIHFAKEAIPVSMLSFDGRVRQNAEALGLEVEPLA